MTEKWCQEPRVFRGSRVPIKNLFDYLVGNDDFKAFLEDFPTVEAEQATEVLIYSLKKLTLAFYEEEDFDFYRKNQP